MVRANNAVASRRRRKKVVDQASGYWGRSSNCFRLAKRAHDGALLSQYRDRRCLKRDMRRLFIMRINAWARGEGVAYSRLMNAFAKAFPEGPLNRKMLANIAFAGDAEKEAMRTQLMALARPFL